MKILEKFCDQYTALATAGHRLGDAYDAILNEYQRRWDNGDRFDLSKISMMDMMNPTAWKRDQVDEEDELSACLAELASKVKSALLQSWVKQYSLSQMQLIVNSLATLDWNGKVVIYGAEVSYSEIVTAWNSTHPEAECKAYLDSGFEI